MATKTVKPNTSARRHLSYVDFQGLSKVAPDKSLTVGGKRNSGRSAKGKIVVGDRGGGSKRLLRLVDSKRTEYLGQKATVETIEYDPNRSAFIAKIVYENGAKSYILAPNDLKLGNTISCDEKTPVQIGNRMKLVNMPISTQIHSIEIVSGHGGQIARSAGNFATLLGFDDKYAIIRIPSSETRKVLSENFATIGVVSNLDHSNVVYGKAGRKRLMGIKPHVRGKAMNPVDHPHGGGEGNTSIGMKYPKTPWGAPALGRRTRNKKKRGSALIMNRRKK